MTRTYDFSAETHLGGIDLSASTFLSTKCFPWLLLAVQLLGRPSRFWIHCCDCCHALTLSFRNTLVAKLCVLYRFLLVAIARSTQTAWSSCDVHHKLAAFQLYEQPLKDTWVRAGTLHGWCIQCDTFMRTWDQWSATICNQYLAGVGSYVYHSQSFVAHLPLVCNSKKKKNILRQGTSVLGLHEGVGHPEAKFGEGIANDELELRAKMNFVK